MAKTARLLVRYGRHTQGETIRGTLADRLIRMGMATDVTPKKKAPAKKAEKAAPENKGDGFDVKG